MPKQRGRSNAESRQDSKRRLLKAGAEEFFNNPASSTPFRGVSFERVARVAGLHRNSIYSHWQGKEDYFGDLTRYLLGDPKLFEKDFAEIEEVGLQSAGLSAVEALCAVANKDVSTLQGNEIWRAMEMLAIGYMPLRPDLHTVARDGYDAVDEETYSLYATVLDRHGRTPRSPFTRADIGKILQALVEGAGIRQTFDRDCFLRPVEQGGHHGVYAHAVLAILCVLTAGPGDSRSLEVMICELLAAPGATPGK
jgi:AcrR family transcriptional regulator